MLIDRIKFATDESIKNNKFDQNTPEWKTHKPWVNKILPNLNNIQAQLLQVLKASKSGDTSGVKQISGVVGGLGKDIDDFDMIWMRPEIRDEINNQIDKVVILADEIHRS